MRLLLLLAISGALVAGVAVLIGNYQTTQKITILIGMPILLAWWVHTFRSFR